MGIYILHFLHFIHPIQSFLKGTLSSLCHFLPSDTRPLPVFLFRSLSGSQSISELSDLTIQSASSWTLRYLPSQSPLSLNCNPVVSGHPPLLCYVIHLCLPLFISLFELLHIFTNTSNLHVMPMSLSCQSSLTPAPLWSHQPSSPHRALRQKWPLWSPCIQTGRWAREAPAQLPRLSFFFRVSSMRQEERV